MTLKEALRVLRFSSIHDYDAYEETAAGERVTMLGLYQEAIPTLQRLVPGLQVEKVQEGGDDFWRIHAWTVR